MPAGTLPKGRWRFSCPLAQPVNSFSAARPSHDAISSSTRSSAPARFTGDQRPFQPCHGDVRPTRHQGFAEQQPVIHDRLALKNMGLRRQERLQGGHGAGRRGPSIGRGYGGPDSGSSAPASFSHPVRRSTAFAWASQHGFHP